MVGEPVGSLRAQSLRKLHPQCGGAAHKVSGENLGSGTEKNLPQTLNHDAGTLSGLREGEKAYPRCERGNRRR